MTNSRTAIICLVIVCLCSFNIKTGHANRAIPDDLIAYPVLVTKANSAVGFGSGFYFRPDAKTIYLISAYHVFMKRDKNKVSIPTNDIVNLLSYPKNLDWSKPAKLEIDLNAMIENKFVRIDSENDIIAIQIGKVKKVGVNKSIMKLNDGATELLKGNLLTVPIRNTKRYADVLIGNDVYISGFPSSLGLKKNPKIDDLKPLLRKGIVAGKYDKKKTITIDCPVFPGNSGGPVAELETINSTQKDVRLIGVIVEFLPFVETWINPQYRLQNIEFENSGYSIIVPIDKVVKLVKTF